MASFEIRSARRQDCGVILALLRELAVYEKLEGRFAATQATIARDFFESPVAGCDLGFAGDEPVAIATFYWTYGSFTAARGLFVEDLFVRPPWRGQGHGKAMLRHLAGKGADRLDWWVLDWNAPAMDFYRQLGARQIADWLSFRLEGEALKRLAS